MDPGLTAALAVGVASYAGYIVPLSPLASKALAMGSILMVAAANIAGLRPGARLLLGLTVIKIGALALIILSSFLGGIGNWSNFVPIASQRAGSAPLAAALAAGMVSGFFSLGGWWDLSKMAGEVRDPVRTFPRAIASGVIAVTLVYLATSAAFMYVVPLEQVGSGETFAAQAGEALFGEAGARVFSGIVIVSVLGSLVAVMMTAPRVYYAMAGDGLFLKSAAAIHQRFRTPARAIAIQAALACLLVAIGTFQQIIAYFIFVTVIFIGLTVAGLFVLRGRPEESPHKTPGYPLTPSIFLFLVLVVLVLLAGHNPVNALLGVGMVLIGLPVYYLAVRGRHR
jgi:APA family basic amino acid/polyamine antiporter